MASEVLLSTTLVTHNRLEDTKRCIGAYVNVTKVPYELIIVDNASTDGTREFLRELVQAQDSIRYVLLNEENLYCGAARNQGFALSSGRYLHAMDNDVLHFPGWDERVLEVFDRLPRVGQVTPFKVPENYVLEVMEVSPGFFVAYSKRNTAGGSNVIRRELWDRGLRWRDVRWKPGCICEDYFMSRDVLSIGYDFVWFTTDAHCCTPGHDKHHIAQNLEYYIKSYCERGNLSLLKQRLEGTEIDVNAYLREQGISLRARGWPMVEYVLRRTMSNLRLFFGDAHDYARYAWRKLGLRMQ